VPGVEQSYIENGVEVIYTRKNETADKRIEKMTRELKARNGQIHVATSDMAEQSVIFGNGVLRKSARELDIDTSII
ncbi:NYN domain-containing protein, partial [Lysinibacillus fusiformis]|uniref:NYN domain-containing protein n=1 Tax=Lysinibacillus fusiformis TaxID=28031 RepID=UPI0020BF1075